MSYFLQINQITSTCIYLPETYAHSGHVPMSAASVAPCENLFPINILKSASLSSAVIKIERLIKKKIKHFCGNLEKKHMSLLTTAIIPILNFDMSYCIVAL